MLYQYMYRNVGNKLLILYKTVLHIYNFLCLSVMLQKTLNVVI